MSERLHPGIHPDPDSLNAFIEGVLPEHERQQCLAHLAECSLCREVVFLAQEAPPAQASPQPSPAWKRWFTPVPVLAAAMVICAAMVAIWLTVHRPAAIPTGDVVAHVSEAPPSAAPSPAPTRPEPEKTTPSGPRKASVAPRGKAPTPTEGSSRPSVATPPAISTPTGTTESTQTAVVVPTLPPVVTPTAPAVPGISGTVIDASGAAINGATIKIRQLGGTATANARTDMTGQFHVTELPAGRYEVQIGAPGFRQSSREVDVQAGEVASVKSQLEVGAVSETVEVTAAASTIQTDSASTSFSVESSRKKKAPEGPRLLPSKLPPEIRVASGKLVLAADSDGAVFLSRNSGKSWQTVKPVWAGEVRSITLANPPTKAKFQLTTDSGAIWLSRDGTHWSAASSPR